MSDFVPFQKIGRLSREIIITEKIDGTNGVIAIGEDGTFEVGSRNRWILPDQDSFGFLMWCLQNKDELMRLGPGRHYGEWWGRGIQRGYDQANKRFSLFNTSRWGGVETRPACCGVVPVLYRGDFDTNEIGRVMDELRAGGSVVAPGFMRPEGIVIYHAQANVLFKKTFEKDDAGKGREQIAEMAA
jgi:hypothetical protein